MSDKTITRFRLDVLRDSEFGSACPTAGLDASNWWRAVDWLQDRGLVVTAGDGCRVTPKGDEWLRDIDHDETEWTVK